MPLEELDGLLVFLCGFQGFKSSEISTLTGFRILFARVEPVTAGLQFPDHLRYLIPSDSSLDLLLADGLERLAVYRQRACGGAQEPRSVQGTNKIVAEEKYFFTRRHSARFAVIETG